MALATQKFFIDGPAGRLETVLGEPQSIPKGIAVIAHPHPLHGGTMDNKVVHTLFTTLLGLGFITAKFNFRGVGLSEGQFDHGSGEIDDVLAVTQTIRDQFSHQVADIPLLLAGFSFGGAIQLHVAKQLAPEFLILVAPSVVNLQAPPVPETTRCALIVQGDKDDIVLPEAVLTWAAPVSQPIVFIPGAGHFFHGKLTILKQLILNYFSNQL
ncbi:alpha/beta hydrolase [Nitrosomonas sp. Is24]|uniref:alpha/beta hydrolase n=1 Tax=Nitrosomonas sp. Is24 TaxID=3080533 RepID=UPI00294B711C|nr:alpha/beta hydrolase [Nitrosomonas sp. Is24]MDV6340690.1 alpha/beta hydrolase [Nitrosomonas sp. Is24]